MADLVAVVVLLELQQHMLAACKATVVAVIWVRGLLVGRGFLGIWAQAAQQVCSLAS